MLSRFRSLRNLSEEVRPQRFDRKSDFKTRTGLLCVAVQIKTMAVDEIRSRTTGQPVTARELT